MYFLNNKALENDLIDLKVSEDEAFKYFFSLSLLISSLVYLNYTANVFELILNLIDGAIQFIISFFAIKKTFAINKAGDGLNYYQRFFTLSFVVMFKSLLYSLILIIPFLFFELLNLSFNEFASSIYSVIASIFINAIFYFLLCKSFKRIADERLLKMQIESVK